jgi:hypothetical protein
MRRIIKRSCNSQRYPHDDQDLLTYDLLREPHFHFKIIGTGFLVEADFMPKEDDVLQICEDLLRVSPTFGQQLLALALAIPMPPAKVFGGKPRRKVTNLAEVLEF